MEHFKTPSKVRNLFAGFTLVGLLTLGIGFVVQPDRAWAGLLVLAFFVLTLALGGGFFTALQFISGSKWSVVLRRVPVSMMALLPVAGILIVILFFGVHNLYEWSHAEVVAKDHLLQYKSGYLNVPFWIGRIVFYFLSWGVLWYFMKKTMKQMDETKNPQLKDRLVRLSAAFMFVFAYTVLFASIDLIMSLEPHWLTTMFPIYAFSGLALSAVAGIIYLIIVIKENGGLPEVNMDHMQDMGKYLFMFVVFWAYIAFSQFMLMWYANMPEETIYLERRIHGEWGLFTGLFWFFHFVVPFAVLLSASIKRNMKKMKIVSIYILFFGYVDVVWMVYGGLEKNIHGWPLSWMELGGFLAAFGLLGLASLSAFEKMNPVPIGDPDLEESKHFHQSF